ncbi:Extracellular metalloproteinase 3 [Metarhizium guizhouense ARSEF 977]|uniref:Extracellular metalloproteinase 3 n=1 Tax=Metarhizium guizhouense (strain ARSEF 977) TaxID=1276136 RepID=A0A0B4I0F7_METGA|nr:Extracellular metalloproteinase 3 [Metarhizium guizhouense ARSEF 977]
MPATDSLQPPLTKAERQICKEYGGWTNFMQSMGLKPWESDDADEGKAILAAFARRDKEEEDKAANNKTNSSSGSKSG